MFDVTCKITYKNVSQWYRNIVRICDQIPIVLLGNKVDIKERKIRGNQILFHKYKSIQYYEISAKSSYQYMRPFISLARSVTGDQSLSLIQEPVLYPQEIIIDSQYLKQLEQEQFEAENVKLPPEEDF